MSFIKTGAECGCLNMLARCSTTRGGRAAPWPYRSTRLCLARKLVSQVGRVDYARVRIVAGKVEPLAISGASLLSSTVIADGFVVVPGDSEGYPPGAEVEVWLYDTA